jgi:hypothetical protein
VNDGIDAMIAIMAIMAMMAMMPMMIVIMIVMDLIGDMNSDLTDLRSSLISHRSSLISHIPLRSHSDLHLNTPKQSLTHGVGQVGVGVGQDI